MKRLSIILTALIFVFLIPVNVLATNYGNTIAPYATNQYPSKPAIESVSGLLIEATTGEIVYSKNINTRAYPASTTKIMTALIVLENCELNETVTVGQEILTIPYDSSQASIDIGEVISVELLLYGLMLPSGNDAAVTLATHTARKKTGNPDMDYNEAIAYFVNMMNEKLTELKLEGSHFVNPHGYHDLDHYTTARDLSAIMREALKYGTFREIINLSKYQMEDYKESQESDEPIYRYWSNSNKLLQPASTYHYPFSVGGKTGYTSASQHCFVGLASKDGTDFISVVLNTSKSGKWTDSVMLYEYGFQNYQLHHPVTKKDIMITMPVINGSGNSQTLNALANDDCVYFTQKSNEPEFKYTYNWTVPLFNINNQGIQLLAPIHQGDAIGSVDVSVNGELLKSIPLLAETDILQNHPTIQPEKPANNLLTITFSPVTIIVTALIILWAAYFIIRISQRRRRNKRLRNPYSYKYRNRY